MAHLGQRDALGELRRRFWGRQSKLLELALEQRRGLVAARGALARKAARFFIGAEAEQPREDRAALLVVATEEGVERALRQQDGLRECGVVQPEQPGHLFGDLGRAVGEGAPRTVG